MSEFEQVAQRRRQERQRARQQALYERIAQSPMGAFAFADAAWLFHFFADKDPSEEDLMQATGIIDKHLARAATTMERLRAVLRGDDEKA